MKPLKVLVGIVMPATEFGSVGYLVIDIHKAPYIRTFTKDVSDCVNVLSPEHHLEMHDKQLEEFYERFGFEVSLGLTDGDLCNIPIFDEDLKCIANNNLVILAEYLEKGYFILDTSGKVTSVTYTQILDMHKQYSFYNYNTVAILNKLFKLYPVVTEYTEFCMGNKNVEQIDIFLAKLKTLGVSSNESDSRTHYIGNGLHVSTASLKELKLVYAFILKFIEQMKLENLDLAIYYNPVSKDLKLVDNRAYANWLAPNGLGERYLHSPDLEDRYYCLKYSPLKSTMNMDTTLVLNTERLL